MVGARRNHRRPLAPHSRAARVPSSGHAVRSWLHQMFPAPGVYAELTMVLQITVSAWTTPLNLDMAASTVTMPADTATWLALTVTRAEAVTVMPLDSSLIELPLLSTISTAPGPSLRVSL